MSAPRPTRQQEAYALIRERLVAGSYPPGHRLNTAELSRELGSSNIPVREALRRLEAEGWVEHSPNAGMRVAMRDVALWVDLMTPFAVLGGFATAHVGPRMTKRELESLETLNARMARALEAEDYVAVGDANQAFHQAIFDRVRNPELRRSLTESWAQLNVQRRELFGAIPVRGRESIEEHAALVQMFRDDAEPMAIEAAAREHTFRTVRAGRAATDRAPAPASATG